MEGHSHSVNLEHRVGGNVIHVYGINITVEINGNVQTCKQFIDVHCH